MTGAGDERRGGDAAAGQNAARRAPPLRIILQPNLTLPSSVLNSGVSAYSFKTRRKEISTRSIGCHIRNLVFVVKFKKCFVGVMA